MLDFFGAMPLAVKYNCPNLKVLHELKKTGVQLFVCCQNLLAENIDSETISPDVAVASDALIVLMTFQNDGYALISFKLAVENHKLQVTSSITACLNKSALNRGICNKQGMTGEQSALIFRNLSSWLTEFCMTGTGMQLE